MVISLSSKKHPLVSITILTYNSEETIEKCLSSVFKVDYPQNRYEVIVVDAGSTDRTLEIMKEFPVDKLIVKKGASRGEARNISIKEAKGEIIAVLDSDEFPANEEWLARAVKDFDDPKVAATTGRDLIPFPINKMSFIKKVLYFFFYNPRRIFFKET